MAFDYEGAKKAGYSDEEIRLYLAKKPKSNLSTTQRIAKGFAKAAPAVGSLVGGIAGTAISPIVGSAAGASLGYAGGRAVGESIEDLAGIQDESNLDQLKSATVGTAATGATSLVLGAAGKVVGKVLSPVKNAIFQKVAPKLTSAGKTASEMVVPPKINGAAPDMMSKADKIFDIRKTLGLKGSPSSQARQAEAIWQANKKFVENTLKNETAKVPGRAVKGTIDEAIFNTIGFDETTTVGKKTIAQASKMLSGGKDAYDLFVAQQKMGEAIFKGAPTAEKEFLKNVYFGVTKLLQETAPAARDKIAENAAIRSIMPSLKAAIRKEGLSVGELIGGAAATMATPGGPLAKLGTATTTLMASTKPGMQALDSVSRALIKAGTPKEAVKKILSTPDVIKSILSSTIGSSTAKRK